MIRNLKPGEIVNLVFNAIADIQYGETARLRARDKRNYAFHNRGEGWFIEREMNTRKVLASSRKHVIKKVTEFLERIKEEGEDE